MLWNYIDYAVGGLFGAERFYLCFNKAHFFIMSVKKITLSLQCPAKTDAPWLGGD